MKKKDGPPAKVRGLDAVRTTMLAAELVRMPRTIVEVVPPDLVAQFAAFAEMCSRFSKEIVASDARLASASPADHVRVNMHISRTIFSKWAIDILALLYARRTQRFHDIKKALGRISSRVLSLKLARLERLDLVEREVLSSRPPRVQYSLTPRGRQVARLGEPVVLYLRLTEEGMASDRSRSREAIRR